MKIFRDQIFWLGAMTAFAIVFLGLFMGMATGKVAIGDSAARVAVGGGAQQGAGIPSEGYPAEPSAPVNIEVEPVGDEDWVRGDRNAKVSVVEFSDIDCPFCSRFHTTMTSVLAKYDGQVNWAYRHLPLAQLHPEAEAKAIASECVGKLSDNDTFWKYLDGLFESQAADEVTAEATKLGIDAAAFEECRKDPKMADKIKDQMAQAERAGGQGTPYSIILVGDEKIPVNGAVPEQQLTAMIEEALGN
jgi:protein-disulfide isomerase